jgi:hypothetical protein
VTNLTESVGWDLTLFAHIVRNAGRFPSPAGGLSDHREIEPSEAAAAVPDNLRRLCYKNRAA